MPSQVQLAVTSDVLLRRRHRVVSLALSGIALQPVTHIGPFCLPLERERRHTSSHLPLVTWKDVAAQNGYERVVQLAQTGQEPLKASRCIVKAEEQVRVGYHEARNARRSERPMASGKGGVEVHELVYSPSGVVLRLRLACSRAEEGETPWPPHENHFDGQPAHTQLHESLRQRGSAEAFHGVLDAQPLRWRFLQEHMPIQRPVVGPLAERRRVVPAWISNILVNHAVSCPLVATAFATA